MLKLALSAIFVCSTTLVGNWFSVRLTNRRRSLCSILEAIKKMKTLICFGGYEIHRVTAESFEGEKGFECFCKPLDDEEDFLLWWNGAVESLDSTIALQKDDKQLLLRFSEGLGVSDTQGQVANCELYTELFTERLKLSKEAEFSRSRLYRILGFSLGCVVILLIM